MRARSVSSRKNDTKSPCSQIPTGAAPEPHERVVLQGKIGFKDGPYHVDNPQSRAPQDHKGPRVQRRKMRYSPKVRTGCVTCKIRRVKCDETKPFCNRCTETGRKCDGYQLPQTIGRPIFATQMRIKPQPRISVLPSPSIFKDVDPLWSNYFQFFREVISPRLCRQLDYITMSLAGTEFDQNSTTINRHAREIFTQLIPQASQNRVEIRHIISAVAALSRHLEFRHQPGQSGLDVVFFRHQAKAIQILSQAKDVHSFEMILMACPLFATCELIQGNMEASTGHIASGWKILQQTSQALSVRSQTGELIEEYFRLLFTYTSSIRASKRDSSIKPSPPNANALGTGTIFETQFVQSTTPSITYQQIWLRLASIAQRLDKIANGCVSPADSDSMTQVRNDLDSWCDIVKKVQLPMGEQNIKFAKILRFSRAYSGVLDMVTYIVAKESESAFDVWSCVFAIAYWQFQAFVRDQGLALSIGGTGPPDQEEVTSAFWLIPPFFLCATRCRVPDLRRNFLGLLRDLNRTEGPWNSSIAADIAVRVIDIEERGLGKVESCKDIPEHRRIRLQIVRRIPNREGWVSLEYKPFPHGSETPTLSEEFEVTDTKWISQVKWPLDKVLHNMSYDSLPIIAEEGKEGTA